MSDPRTTAGEANRLGLASWCLYDWANSAFPTIVTTFVFSVYFTPAVADNPVDGAVQWSHSVTAASLAVVLSAPALGAIADGLGRRKPWLFAFTALTVAGTLALWLVSLRRPTSWPARCSTRRPPRLPRQRRPAAVRACPRLLRARPCHQRPRCFVVRTVRHSAVPVHA